MEMSLPCFLSPRCSRTWHLRRCAFRLHEVRPNPSIERTSSGLRPPAAAHVKRLGESFLGEGRRGSPLRFYEGGRVERGMWVPGLRSLACVQRGCALGTLLPACLPAMDRDDAGTYRIRGRDRRRGFGVHG